MEEEIDKGDVWMILEGKENEEREEHGMTFKEIRCKFDARLQRSQCLGRRERSGFGLLKVVKFLLLSESALPKSNFHLPLIAVRFCVCRVVSVLFYFLQFW